MCNLSVGLIVEHKLLKLLKSPKLQKQYGEYELSVFNGIATALL